MGIAAMRKILGTQPFDPAQLRGRTLAVDADNLIWSFATALAAAEEPVPAPHLFGLVSRLAQYARWGARSAWVFDGAQPDLKAGTLIARAERVEAARARLQASREAVADAGPGGPAGPAGPESPEPPGGSAGPAARAARQAAQAAVWVGEEELAECRDLLTALGVPWVVAPGESDAQCAHLARAGHAWAAVTQDWDIALFGAPRALRNLTLSKTRTPELLDLAAALEAAKLTREQLVDAALLIGTDYNEGVAGVGPVKAVALVKRHGDVFAALKALRIDMPRVQEARDVFLAHPLDEAWTPAFGAPDEPAARALLDARGIRGTRVDDLLAALRGPDG